MAQRHAQACSIALFSNNLLHHTRGQEGNNKESVIFLAGWESETVDALQSVSSEC